MAELDQVDAVLAGFHQLHLKDNKKKTVPFHKFKHSSKSYFPANPQPFFISSKELALYTKNKIFHGIEEQNKDNFPLLKDDIAHLATCRETREAKRFKNPYLGECLFEGFTEDIPLMTNNQLQSLEPLLRYMDDYRSKHGEESYGSDRKWVIVSTRHVIIDLIMLIFSVKRETYNLRVTVSESRYLLFESLGNNKMLSNPSGNLHKKIVYSGFQFEKVMIENANDEDGENVAKDELDNEENSKNIENYLFAIVENVLTEDITLLLRCEMDAYNYLTKEFTELKCYSKLSMSNMYHRLKLLKTYIQINMIPTGDLIIGTRSNYDGLLQDINRYTRKSVYRMINNRNNKVINNVFNLNANIAVQWQKHCLESIVSLIESNYDPNVLTPQVFNICIDTKRNIHIIKPKSVT